MSENNILTRFSRMVGAVSIKFGDICVILLLLMGAITTWDVFMRYVFNSPSIWITEVSQYMLAAIASLGSCYTLKLKRHIAVDILVEHVPEHFRKYFTLTANIISFIAFSILAVLSYELWIEAVRSGEKTWTQLGVPFGFLYSYVFIGMLILAFQSACNTIEDILKSRERHS
jgi:C4-dicarboxylate transporter, DctQ subunit